MVLCWLLWRVHCGPGRAIVFFNKSSSLKECIVTRGNSYWEWWTILQCYYFHMYQTLIAPSYRGSILFSTYSCVSSASSVFLLGAFQNSLVNQNLSVESFTKVPSHIFQVNVVSQINDNNNIIYFYECWFAFAIFLLQFI